jgi:hypothetical protein
MGNHVGKMINEFVGKFLQPAGVIGGRRHHLQGLKTNHTNECLHGVVCENTTTAANTWACLAGNPAFMLLIRMGGNLETGDDVNCFTCLGILAGPDGAIRHDDAWAVMFQ